LWWMWLASPEPGRFPGVKGDSMALLTVSLAAVGLAVSTLLVTASSQSEPVETGPDSIVCRTIAYGVERTLPAGSHCAPRTEVEVTPTP
jgi:hypothetical protein